ncbi:hypothetical protein [Aquimonas sp.]|uniref:hypothetical protein n=1 Tax=Aquimonas sp. TaxID=1872588 RepID=UPI0037C15C6B
MVDGPNSSALKLSLCGHRLLGLTVGDALSLPVLLRLPLASLAIVRRELGRPDWPFDLTPA